MQRQQCVLIANGAGASVGKARGVVPESRVLSPNYLGCIAMCQADSRSQMRSSSVSVVYWDSRRWEEEQVGCCSSKMQTGPEPLQVGTQGRRWGNEARMREIQISLLGARRAGVQQQRIYSTPPHCFQSARRAWKR